jgi:hypothetical protein
VSAHGRGIVSPATRVPTRVTLLASAIPHAVMM